MSTITKNTLTFLSDLRENNNKPWFLDHKKEVDAMNLEFKQFAQTLELEFSKYDKLDPVKIFRLYRDVRFSADKTPYKSNLGLSFGRQKPWLRGGYYVHIEPNASFVGGGFWAPEPHDLKRIRQEIEVNAAAFQTVFNDKEFIKTFGKIEGESLKNVPKGFEPTSDEAMALIKLKQFLVSKQFSNEEIIAPSFPQQVVATFQAMRPFFDLMSTTLTTNLNGEPLH